MFVLNLIWTHEAGILAITMVSDDDVGKSHARHRGEMSIDIEAEDKGEGQ